MSSRAAASRKRLVPGEHTRPSSSKGLFSRSKPTPASQPTPIDLTEPDALPPTQPFKLSNNTNNDSRASSPYRTNIYTKHDPFTGGQIGASPQVFGKVASGPIVPSSAYPSPPHDVGEYAPHQVVQLTSRSPRGNGPNEHESTFIEASYQPPPPIQASYQPPPPTHSRQVNGPHNTSRSIRKYSPPSEEFDSISSFPPPPNYPPPLLSTPNRNLRPALPSPPSTQHSLLLQRSSPTPTELPTYSSVHETPYSTPSRVNRIPFEQPVNNSPLSHLNNSPLPHHGRSEYSQQYDPTSYPSSLPLRPQRFTPSPYQTRDISPVHSATLLPSENEFRRPTYRGGSSDGTSSPLSAYQVPPANPMNFRPGPESVSGSSDSSSNSKSPSSQNGPSAASPVFVFPGSRSVARPKVSAKTGTPTFGIKIKSKSRARQNSDASLTTPPPTPSSAGSNDSRAPSVGFPGTVPRGNDQRIINTQRQLNSFSDPALAFRDDSADQSLNQVVNGTWTAPNSTAVATTSPTSPNPTSSNPDNAPPKLVYPGGRSRAKPSKPPVIKPKKPKRPASAGDEHERGERSRFMGLLKRKKQPKTESSGSFGTASQSSSSETNTSPTELRSASLTSNEENSHSYEPHSMDLAHQEAINRAQRAKSRIGSYPLDPYDSVLLDNDRHTGELLVRLNPTGSPSFHNYGNMPPASVLDLGCGQGHWVVDAAIAWRGYGTKVTGYDMVDISRGLLPWASEQGVIENIRFVRGNFLKQRLPFSDNSFDLVRMSCLALCTTSDSWVFLLQEVCRVLMVGGRLELIDDLVFFPYGKASSALDLSTPHSPPQSIAPKLDISIPSSSFTTFSIYDGEVTNPGLGLSISGDEDEDEEEEIFDLYEVEEEPDFDDTATLNGREPQPTLPPSLRSRPTSQQPRSRASSPVLSLRSWNRAQATSGDLEALFDHMLSHKFGIRKDLNDFILDLLKDVFGHAREVRTMHLALAPPETELENGALNTRRGKMGLSGSPGLILWPSTFIPMSQSEIEIHASKHLRMLLSCKNFLLEHALEATDDEEIDEESVLEALWEYEGFLRHRFNPPPLQSSPYDGGQQDSDAVSIRGSIAESVSSDSREAMWEIQSEFREHFMWQGSASTSRSPTPKEDTPRINALVPSATPSSSQSTLAASPVLSSITARNPHRDTDVISSNAAPLYSRDELTRVRTFRIYEAIKIDEAIFGSVM